MSRFPRGLYHHAAVALLMSLAVVCAVVGGYPKPAPVPFRWELEFEPGELRLYIDPTTTDPFWYFTYTITNRTGKDQLWAPSFVLYSDAGDLLQSGRDVPTRITEELMAMLGNRLLEDQNSIIGDILQGRENAREGLVIWPARNLKVNEISMFIAGLSGETARVKNPINDHEVILRKTLERDYLLAGDALARGGKAVDFVEQQWIMR